MTDNDTLWILSELDESAREWNEQPEWTKPLISAPYFASRGATSANTTAD